MRGITHLVVGLAAGVGVARFFGVHDIEAIACVLVGGVGGLLPDIDHPKALISKYAIGIGGAMRLVVSHRGATHTLAFTALVALVIGLAAFPLYLAAALLVGMILHLAADMLTTDGVRLFRPLHGGALRLLPYSLLWVAAPFIEQATLCAALVVPALAILGVNISVT